MGTPPSEKWYDGTMVNIRTAAVSVLGFNPRIQFSSESFPRKDTGFFPRVMPLSMDGATFEI